MELVTRQIKRNKRGEPHIIQFLIDEDINVPDSKKDIYRVITGEGKLLVDEICPTEQYVRVKGRMCFHILYAAEGSKAGLDALTGQIPFEEMIYTDEGEIPYVLWQAKVDVSTIMIHSRKIKIKGMAEVEIGSESQQQETLTVDVQGEESVMKKEKEVNLLKLHLNKKDTCRIKEEVILPGTKESLGRILWWDVTPRKTDTRLESGALHIAGELMVFCFYESPDSKLDWVEQTIPYEGQIDCYEATPEMYHEVSWQLTDVSIEMGMDEDGEMRAISLEGTLEMKIAVYEEEKMGILEDLYSTENCCETEKEVVTYEEILLQNHSKCKITERLELPELRDDILQICHSNGDVRVESTQLTEAGILVEGVLSVSFLYVKTDDKVPFGIWEGLVPFQHLITTGELSSNACYNLVSSLEQISVTLMGGDNVEVKAMPTFRSLIRQKKEAINITGIVVKPYEEKGDEKQPGIIGYLVKDEDDLWEIAKKYRTTKTSICEANGITEESIKTGQRILILKENVGIL